MNHFERVIELIDIQSRTKGAIVLAQFGDNWQDYAIGNLAHEDVIRIAWTEGRRAILLERSLKQMFDENEKLKDRVDKLEARGRNIQYPI